MDTTSPRPGTGDLASQSPLTPRAAILAGDLDAASPVVISIVAIIVLKKYFWNDL